MSLLRKIEISVLFTLVLAIISFAFWLGGLNSRINEVSPKINDIKQMIDKEIDTFKEDLDSKFANKSDELEKAINEKSKHIDKIYEILPVGSIIAFSGKKGKIPEGWALCDGRSLNSDKYKKLYEVIGESWGGDKVGSFNLPDIRGRFLRGVDYSAKRDKDSDSRGESALGSNKGNEVGSSQIDSTRMPNTVFVTNATGKHTHSYVKFKAESNDWKGGGSKSGGYVVSEVPYGETDYNTNHSHLISSGGDKETRPINIYVNWIIKLE